MICGIDEAGRGPVIGPMVVAAVWIDKKEEWKLLEAKVRDSKKLIKQRREKLAEYIKKNFYHEYVVVDASDIDNLRKTMTMNQLEAYIFAKLANKREASIYYIDAASNNEEEFKKTIQELIKHDCQIICEHGADDKYAVVSAASIIAKVERDERIKKIAEELEAKLGLPLGSGYPSDERTITFIKEWIRKFNDLPPHTRKSWKTIKNIENEMKQSKLF
ncbi:MAG: ribonuclease HII [Thermoplasmata archaeon]|nr:MAG: ribonuclease HII [Thermoplasmata archaeon]